MLSPDEALGVVGKVEGVRQQLDDADRELVKFAAGQPINITEIMKIPGAVSQLTAAATRLQQEAADPDGAFGTP